MENKKFDLNSLIGFILIGGILIWMLYQNAPTEEELHEQARIEAEAKVKNQEPTENTKVVTSSSVDEVAEQPNDSLAQVRANAALGDFGYSNTFKSNEITTFENDVLLLKIANKGGQIVEAKMKNYKSYDSIPIYLVKDNNASFNLQFKTKDNRTLNTSAMYFEPIRSKQGENEVLSMRLKVSNEQYIEYRYELKPGVYMLDFDVRSKGLENTLDITEDAVLDWKLKGYRHAKSISYENRYTEAIYEYDDGKDDYLGQQEFTEDEEQNVTYIAFKQHFFTSILLTDTPFKTGKFTSTNLVEDEEIDTLYTKEFTAQLPLAYNGGELNHSMNWYYGPSDYKILNDYNRNLDEVVPLGWGIFGWINRYIFIPFFAFITSFGFISYGVAIIIMTIVVRIVLSPVTYKSYLSQAKMKVLRPEINEINEKYKDNAMKKQQETMKLYSKAGASPMSGCLPALMQIPVFYALFQFFPSAFQLRQKSFLWADDLSSYDAIAELPFTIPFYGDHVSLFPILASVAIFFYMTMTTGQTMQTQQPGMPNMKFIMYLSPLLMLFFFNNYASGLSLYYFISNLITIGIMLVIKNVILDDEKIHAKIQENKKKPKKQNKFSKKMQEMMAQAEAQKNANKK